MSETSAPAYRSPVSRAKVVTGAFIAYWMVTVWALYLSIDGIAMADQMLAARDVGEAAWAAWEQQMDQLMLATVATRIFIITGFCFWVHRVAWNARQRVPESIQPGWAVGWFFIPIMNFFKPVVGVGEIWKNSHRRPAEVTTSLAIVAWWAFWIMSIFVVRRGQRMLESAEGPGEWRDAMVADLIGLGFDLAAGILCVVVVWRLTRLQEQTAAPALPAARVVGD